MKGRQAGLKTFSWFIYRITTPALRECSCADPFVPLEERFLSTACGDIFGKHRSAVRSWSSRSSIYFTRSSTGAKSWRLLKRRRAGAQARLWSGKSGN